jgi:hypothetical protein
MGILPGWNDMCKAGKNICKKFCTGKCQLHGPETCDLHLFLLLVAVVPTPPHIHFIAEQSCNIKSANKPLESGVKCKYLRTAVTYHSYIHREIMSTLNWGILAASQLTLSVRMLIYNRHGNYASMDECRYMIDKVSSTFLSSNVDHMWPLATVFCACVFMNFFICLLPFGSHYLNFLRNKGYLYITACHMFAACFYVLAILGPLDWKNDI